MTSPTKLRPCQRCGAAPEFIAADLDQSAPTWQMYCYTCGGDTTVILYGTLPGGTRRAIVSTLARALTEYPDIAPGDLPSAARWLLERVTA